MRIVWMYFDQILSRDASNTWSTLTRRAAQAIPLD